MENIKDAIEDSFSNHKILILCGLMSNKNVFTSENIKDALFEL